MFLNQSASKRTLEGLLDKADIKINGNRTWDIQVHNQGFYNLIISEGSLGAGESYMDGWWDVEALDEFCYRLFKLDAERRFRPSLRSIALYLNARFRNLQTQTGSKKVAEVHYNLSNDFYMYFLGQYNQYTSLYYPKGSESFEAAELARLDLICRKLKLTKNDRVLDIGCGWGGFARYAAENYGCKVTGISIATEQIDFAKTYTAGLSVRIKNQDYRNLVSPNGQAREKFSKIFSGGMIEHVGSKNYHTFMGIVNACLDENGLFLLDCLGQDKYGVPDPWSDKYIFPNSHIPSTLELAQSFQGTFIIEDWHNFGLDYAKTALEWFQRFDSNWEKIQKLDKRFDDRFYRMWKFYLMAGSAKLRVRDFQQWQIVFSRGNLADRYTSVR